MSYRNPNRGVAYSRNFGINRATTEFVMPVDADDYIDATYLERAMSFFDSHPDFTLYYGRWVFIGENAEQMNSRFGDLRYTGYKDLLISNSVHCSCAYRRADAVRCGLFDERLAGYEDWEFLIRLLHDNHTVGWDPRASLYYRQLPKSRTEADH